MEIKQIEFIGSFPKVGDCPKEDLPEYAFTGRSNVGKSSLINMLCERKDLARVSNKPGKTQLINYFLINQSWRLVDLPGYGYAQTSKKQRFAFGKMIQQYLLQRESLRCVFVLVDANIPPQAIDVGFINWLGEKQIPFVIVYTKTDRPSRNKLKNNIEEIQHELLKFWNELPQQFVTSARKGQGREEVLQFIEEVNKVK